MPRDSADAADGLLPDLLSLTGAALAPAEALLDRARQTVRDLVSEEGRVSGALVEARSWEEYSVGRAGTQEHLAALDLVYQGVITSYREDIDTLEDVDHVSQDMLIAQTAELELFHWFVRAHLESTDGSLATADATTEKEAVRSVS